MIEKQYDTIVIGGGAAGMAAALSVAKHNLRVAVIEREEYLGGILLQCIHNGFGLHQFKEELTGPEYAQRFSQQVADSDIDVYLSSTAMQMDATGRTKTVIVYSKESGVSRFTAQTIVLAMGCRERNRGNIGIPGTRPAGVFTAGLAQRLINIDGYVPGRKVVIVGSGDIGLIMARRLSWVGAEVLAVVEIMPYPSGIARNIVQCLHDFDIPLYLSHIVSKIAGRDRVEGVEIAPLQDGKPDLARSFELECDTILLSVGLVPENELSKAAGVEISHNTNGPYVNADLMTNTVGVFACGNVLHVHDLVDFVSEEAERCGQYVARYVTGATPSSQQFETAAGPNVKYVLPNRYDPARTNKFYLRSLVVKNNAKCLVKCDGQIIKTIAMRHVQPAEMISISLGGDDLSGLDDSNARTLEFSLQ